MFEKEAEEYREKEKDKGYYWVTQEMEQSELDTIIDESFKDGAEFGYNKAFVEADKNLKAVVADFNKANEWHYVKDGDLPKDTTVLYLVRVYSWDFGFSHLYKKNGTYIPTVCEWNGEYFKALDSMAYSNARNIKNCFAWKEIVLPKESEND